MFILRFGCWKRIFFERDWEIGVGVGFVWRLGGEVLGWVLNLFMVDVVF